MRKLACATLVITILSASLFSLAACRPSEPIYPIEPEVLLLSPAYGSELSSGPITVKVYVESVKLVDKIGQSNVPGEGHLIYYLDADPPVSTGITATPSTGTFAMSTELSHTWDNVAPGEHILAVQVLNNDNTPMRAPSAVWVKITVK
jgi:hypothetical protein